MRRMLAAVPLVLALGLPAAAQASFPGQNGRIAFTSDRTGSTEIYTANPDGSGVVQLTSEETWGSHVSPAWSPDGSRLALVTSVEGSRWTVAVANADGSGLHDLVANPWNTYDDAAPAWSPDGSKVVYASTRPLNDAYRLWVVNADGSGLHQLTSGWGYAPAWSPDGSKVAYEGPGGALWVVNADGTDAHQLTSGVQPESSPSWSPDGTKLVFGRYETDWHVSSSHPLYVVNADGTGERQLTSPGGMFDALPSWSPDGYQILFHRYEGAGGGLELMRVDADATGLTPISVGPGRNSDPDWAAASAPPPPPDTRAPLVDVRLPAPGQQFLLGELVHPVYSCVDEQGGSGVEACDAIAGQSADRLDTSRVGRHDFTVVARDLAGNQATYGGWYVVVWPFAGFYAPVSEWPALTPADAGKAVPLRFSLGGYRGADIVEGASGRQVLCSEPLASQGSSVSAAGTLSYNATQDRYTYQWPTQKSWSSTCWRLDLTLRDGTLHRAAFKFGK